MPNRIIRGAVEKDERPAGGDKVTRRPPLLAKAAREFRRHGACGVTILDRARLFVGENDGSNRSRRLPPGHRYPEGRVRKAELFEQPASPTFIHIGHPASVESDTGAFDLAPSRTAGYGKITGIVAPHGLAGGPRADWLPSIHRYRSRQNPGPGEGARFDLVNLLSNERSIRLTSTPNSNGSVCAVTS